MSVIQHESPGEDFHVKLGAAGRMVMPAPIRASLHMSAGDTLVLRPRPDGAVEVRTREQMIKQAQDYICSLAPPERLLSEELIAERRLEAARGE